MSAFLADRRGRGNPPPARPACRGAEQDGACETDNAQHWAKPDRAAAARESTPVHAGDGLHEAVALHRRVGIHRVQAGRVKAGQPHVAHDHDLEEVLRVLELVRQIPPLLLVADVLLPLGAVLRATGCREIQSWSCVCFASAWSDSSARISTCLTSSTHACASRSLIDCGMGT